MFAYVGLPQNLKDLKDSTFDQVLMSQATDHGAAFKADSYRCYSKLRTRTAPRGVLCS